MKNFLIVLLAAGLLNITMPTSAFAATTVTTGDNPSLWYQFKRWITPHPWMIT